MKLIFIRHGEPDYVNDSLTSNGRLEADALAQRIKDWDVTEFFVSPQGRAQETAQPTLSLLGREAKVLDFLHEFSYAVDDPVTGRHGVPWDFVSSDWMKYDDMFKLGDSFMNYPCIKENAEIPAKYREAIDGIDEILKSYGYSKDGRFYRNANAQIRYLSSTTAPDKSIVDNGPELKDGEKEPVLVFFCHLGITCLMLSHLVNIPFETLTHGFYLAPTSITVLSTEERWGDEASFRIQCMGDVNHLHKAGLPVSPAGFFASPFQG